jgi:HAE1 family hydrophobic/amphiphilic exporter-1/multidrug efflux pump
MGSSFFIRRPIFATVLSLVILIAGLVSFGVLPVTQYPKISPPTVTISATYSGANAETVAKVVAAPIEEQLSGVEGLLYFNSSASSNGSVSITATFEVGTDIDMAMVEVNNRIKMVEPKLPEDVRRNGVSVRNKAQDMLMVLGVLSPDSSRDTLFLSNYSSINLVDDLKRVPGVGDVTVFGARDYSMRVWLDPDKLSHVGMTTSEVLAAISAQNTQNSVGKIGQEPVPNSQALTFTVVAKGRLLEASDFENIVIRQSADQGSVLLKDVARIELGAQAYDSATFMNGTPAIGMGIFLQSGANALEVAESVNNRIAEMRGSFPSGLDIQIAYDTTTFIDASIESVVHTLLEALVLVSLVVFLFLQNWRATLIPLVAVPISIVGTLAGLWAMDFSINTLTLFAMVLAIGIVVDDAIVVIENVERLMHEHGLSAKEASLQAMKEVAGALVAIVLVLCAVFVPVSFLGGIAGALYKQFAVTVAIAVIISGFVALTLTPALCASFLKPHKAHGRFFTAFNRGFERVTGLYLFVVKKILAHRKTSIAIFAATLGGIFWLSSTLPKSFVPSEDQAILIGSVQLPDGASMSRTSNVIEQYRQMLSHDPAVASVFGISGFDFIGGGSKSNAGALFIRLAPRESREAKAQDLAMKYMGMGMGMEDGMVLVFNPPAIQGIGSTGGIEFYIQNRADGDAKELAKNLNAFLGKLKENPSMASANTFFRADVPQLFVEVNEKRALALGVDISAVYSTLQATIGTVYVNDFNRSGKTYRVQVQADAEFRDDPQDIGKLYVKNAQGKLVPMSALATVGFVNGPEQIERFNGFISVKVTANGKAGLSSGELMKVVEGVAAETLPDGYHVQWTGQAFQEQKSGSSGSMAMGFAVLMVFLILAAQYERWSLPLGVILSIPFAIIGAYGALLLRGMPNDIYFQIGLVVLVGLAAKNSILIVEFAQQQVEQGKNPVDAAIEAAHLRFRPIVMTSLAFILGILPLAMATGAGAAARQSMGTGVLGGMMASTFIATLFVPLLFVLMTRREARQVEQAEVAE